MKLKQGMSLVFVWVLVLHSVWAQEANSNSNFSSSESLMTDAGIAPGTNPDAFSYKLGNFWEGISYSFTFDREAKTQKGLQIARKHLWEVKVFSENKDLGKAQKAQDEYSAWISKVKSNIEATSTDDPKEELEKNMQLNVELEKEDHLLEGVKSDIASSSKLSVEEKEKASKILDKAGENNKEVKRTAEEKKEKAQTKFKARFGLKEKELREEVRKLESKSVDNRSSKEEINKEEKEEGDETLEPKKGRNVSVKKEHPGEKKKETGKIEGETNNIQEEEKNEEKNETLKLRERAERVGEEKRDKEDLREEGRSKDERKDKPKED